MLKWTAFAVMMSLACLLTFGYFVYSQFLESLPDIKALHHVHYETPLKIYSSDKLLIGQFGEQNRIPISIEHIPPLLIKAFVAAEDEHFFEHQGVDYKGLLRAGLQLTLTGKKKQGGSTITMQVTRNFLISREKTYLRKLKEIILALRVEREYSKNKILELYLNQIYLGHRSYGVNAAAQTYYGKPLHLLTLAEHAMIAGLPKAPSAYNPITNETRALQRRNYVLRRMFELNFITKKEFDDSLKQPSTAKLQYRPVELAAPYVAEMARKEMVRRYGQKAYTSGFNAYTTITQPLQSAATNALIHALHNYDERHGYRPSPKTIADNSPFDDLPVVGDTLPAYIVEIKENKIKAKLQNNTLIDIPEKSIKWIYAARGLTKDVKNQRVITVNDVIRVRRLSNNTWTITQVPQAEGAFVAIKADTGAILALTGGFDYFRNKFNRAIQTKRQPGSGFKPIIYTAALEEGFTPASIINDEPIVIEDPNQESEWRPENYSRNFVGPTSLRKALIHSSNVISIRLLEAIGIDKAVATAMRFGFSPQQIPNTLSLALGSGYASPLQMARAYAVFANGGFLINPYLIERIETKEGDILFQADPPAACPVCDTYHDQNSRVAPRIMSPDINFLMNSLLRDVVQHGTATDAKVLGRQDLAGKTGTTNDFRDAWFNGYTPAISATAWIGFDHFNSLGNRETGGTTALPMWVEFMKTALSDLPESPLVVPQGIVQAFINPNTGRLEPAGSKYGVLEYFQEGLAPTHSEFSDEGLTEKPSSFSNGDNGKRVVDQPVEALF
ncbi:MAG: penicillin-binding protein 1A [Methylosarcina sp.]